MVWRTDRGRRVDQMERVVSIGSEDWQDAGVASNYRRLELEKLRQMDSNRVAELEGWL